MRVKSVWNCLGISLLTGSFLLTACHHPFVAETNKHIEAETEVIEDNLQKAKIPDMPEPVDTVRMKNDIWLGDTSIKIMEGDAFPARFERSNSITLAIAKDTPIEELAREITEITGIQVRIDDLKSEDAVPTKGLAVNYTGKLSGLLNYIANRYGLWWHYKNGQVSFFTKETRTFTVYALPTESKMQADLKGTSMSSSTTGSGGQSGNSSVSSSAETDMWKDIEDGVKQVLGDEGKVVFSHPTGTVTVTASPYMIQKVGQYINGWNDRLSRQVAISVKVLLVQVSSTDNYGIDLNLVFNNKNFSGSFTNGFTKGKAETASNLGMALIRPSSDFAGSSAIIDALSTQGKTSIVTTASVTTLNNKIAPVQITTTQNYVKETSVTNNNSSSNSNTETDIETDTLNYGFTMDLLPRILDHGRLMLLVSLNLSELIDLERFSTSGTSEDEESEEEEEEEDEGTIVQLPKMETRSFLQEIAMTSGTTLVLTGFEKAKKETDTEGIGRPEISILGGRDADERVRDVMVILITPEVLESPMSPESRMREF